MKPVTFSLFCSLLIWTLFSHWITNIDGETTPPALTPDGEHPLFYIYEWPEELDDVYPPLNATMHPSSSYDHAFRDNRGAGKLLVPELGLFQTWQFSLYKNMMARLRVSKYRTRDPSKATSFIIPFDAGVHSYIDHRNGKPRLASPHGWRAISLLQYASKNETFWKHHGHNHFIFFSITVYQMVGIGVKVFFMEICQNCTSITIETSPTFTAISGRSKKYWYAAPYPSSFHWYDGLKALPWRVTEETLAKRDLFVLFIGSVKTSNTNSNFLRRTLHTQCTRSDGSATGSGTTCTWFTTAHACNGVVNATNQMLLFQRAIFCPAPPGDSITRKSIFDSLVSGCIPVIFAKGSINQYLWYFSKTQLEEVSVYIPKQTILEGANFLDILREIPAEEIRKKQYAIEKIASTLQYSVVPSHIDPDRGDTWESPVKDAADIAIEKILDRKTIEPIAGYSEMELSLQKCLQNDIMQNHADYAGLGPGKSKGEAGSNIASRIWNKNNCHSYNRSEAFRGSTFTIEW